MAKYPMPDKESHYWAKLVHPTRMPAGNDWKSVDWEVVQTVRNHDGSAGHDPDEEWGVLVPGIGPMQWAVDFVWGPEVVLPPELGGKDAPEDWLKILKRYKKPPSLPRAATLVVRKDGSIGDP